MSSTDFIDRYFIEPVMSSQGYNIYNTLVYGVLFLISVYFVGRLLKRLEIKLDEELFWALAPFVVLGGIVRALGQLSLVRGEGLPPSFWLFTPGIYILIAAYTLFSLLASVQIKGEEYRGMMQFLGGSPAVIGLLYILSKTEALGGFILVIGASALVGAVTYILIKGFHPDMLTKSNLLLISGYVLDSTTTTMASAYLGYAPEHVLTGIISSASPFLFLPFKISLILAALYFIEKDTTGEEKWLLKLALLILGLPHGIHDSLQILMGV